MRACQERTPGPQGLRYSRVEHDALLRRREEAIDGNCPPNTMLPILTRNDRFKKVPSMDTQSAKAAFLEVLPGQYKLAAQLSAGYELEEEPTIVVDRQHIPSSLLLRVRQLAKKE